MKICKRCIMDTTDPEIVFDKNGICNHCHSRDKRIEDFVVSGFKGIWRFSRFINKVKQERQKKDYDCIIGVSGGVDSSYALYQAKVIYDLKPLAIHLDNGWNDKTADYNIKILTEELGIDLFTYKLNKEFLDIQESFLNASVPDLEIPTDYAITATLYELANKLKIPYIISGNNVKTESHIPRSWSQGHWDYKYIKGIHERYGRRTLKSFPKIHPYTLLGPTKCIRILNYIGYNRTEAINELIFATGWKPYGNKHSENIYTRLYQNYILPTKFGYDKRKSHLSSLICAGEITREEALKRLEKETYSSKLFREDKEFFLRKFEIDEVEFKRLMKLPNKSYFDYPNNNKIIKNIFFQKLYKYNNTL